MIEEILTSLFRNEIPLPDSPLKYFNSYVIRSGNRNLVIDTGLNRTECLRAMRAGLRELELDLEKTDFFITHLHADHFALVSKLATDTSKIYLNGPDREIIEAPSSWEAMIYNASMNGFPEEKLRAALHSHPGYKRERIEELKHHHQKRADEILVILENSSKNAFQVAAEMT